MDELILALPFGLLIGAVTGAVGGGGAILALPVLVYVLGEGVGPATTASLIVVALAASAGAASLALRGRVCWKSVLAFSLPAAPGAYAGTLASASVDPRLLVASFVPVMLAAAALTYRRGSEGEEAPDADCPRVDALRTGLCGLGVGVLTGSFGVGGGFLIVPALTLVLGLSVRRAIASSLAIITLTGVAALASHLLEGARPDWELTLVLCAAAAAGALAGTALGRRLPARNLARGFGLIVGLIACLLLLDVALLGGPPTQ